MRYNIPDRVFHDIKKFAVKHNIKKIILFGSRARGDHYERSDIDIAVSGGDFDGFYFDTMENAYTLLLFDIVDLDAEISGELEKEIEKDGVVIYEKD